MKLLRFHKDRDITQEVRDLSSKIQEDYSNTLTKKPEGPHSKRILEERENKLGQSNVRA